MSSPTYGWPLPTYPTSPPDAPAAFAALAGAIEDTYEAPPVTYIPTWVADGSVQPTAPSVTQGWWSQRNGWCTVAIYLGFGPSTTGGRGALRVALPQVAAAVEQFLPCKLFVPGLGDFVGSAWIQPGAMECRPQFPIASTSAVVDDWRSLSTGGTAGTGVPPASGAATVQNTGNLVITGRYAVA
jgi:hypothetical protein